MRTSELLLGCVDIGVDIGVVVVWTLELLLVGVNIGVDIGVVGH